MTSSDHLLPRKICAQPQARATHDAHRAREPGLLLLCSAFVVALFTSSPASAGVNYWEWDGYPAWGWVVGCVESGLEGQAACWTDYIEGAASGGHCGVTGTISAGPTEGTTNQWTATIRATTNGSDLPNNGIPNDCLGPAQNFYYAVRFTDGCAAGDVTDLYVDGCAPNVGPYDDPPNECRDGNPCSAPTRGKLQTFVDSEAPGIRFARTWRSRNAPEVAYAGVAAAADGRLPWGWTHSYASRVVLDGSGEPTAVFRPDGTLVEVFESSTDIYLATDASGLQVQGSGSNDITVFLPDGSKELYGHHSDTGCSAGFHRLDAVIDAGGRETTIGYATECSAHPVEVVGPFGHTLEIAYATVNGLERIVEVVGADGEPVTYAYVGTGHGLATGQLEYVTYQDLSVLQYHYDDAQQPRYLSGITDELDVRYATFAYNSQGYAISTTHIGGNGEWSFAYEADGTSTATDANDVATVYEFQTAAPKRRIVGSITRDGETRTLANETSGQFRLLSVVNENASTTVNTYDTYHLTSTTEADGDTEERLTAYDYLDDTTSRLTSVTTPSVYGSSTREVATTYTMDDLPETIEVTGYTPTGTAVSRSVTLEYNAYGQITEIDGPRTDVSDVTTLTYYECTAGDECGQLESVTNAAGHVATYDTYDASGRLTQMTDPNGVVTTYVYDLRGRLTNVTETPPSGPARETVHVYDDAGQLTSVEAPNGTVLTYDYDDAHHLVSITDNLGNVIEYGYDLAGNRTEEDVFDVSSNLRKTVDFTYDARNRVDTINAAGSITDLLFDALGNLTDETDPNDNDTAHGFDPLNRLSQTLDALSGVTEYGYDVNDFLTSVEAANGASTSYVYDDLGNLLSTTSPDTGTTTYTYDAAGNRTSQTDANSVTVEFSYDALNRLTEIEFPNSSLDVTFTYDQGTNQKGRLTTMVDDAGTTTLEYDVFGNLTEESKLIDGNTHVTAYSYDAADLLTGITYPSGRTVDYTRNVLGQVTLVESTYNAATITVADDIEYEPFGPLKALSFGNTLAMSRTFDQQYRLAAQTTGAVQDLTFTLDDAGNIDAIEDGVDSGLDQTFTQDELHRLDAEDGAYGAKGYTYDEVGNRLTRTHGMATQTLTYETDSNRLATHTGNTVTLDDAGNTTDDPTEDLSFVYDDRNRMVEAYDGAVLKASYVYDGYGQRVKKIEATGAQRTLIYHYGQGGELLGETIYNSGGAKIGERDYLWLDTLPLAQSERTFSGGSVTSSQLVYLHADQLNTPRLATNASGTIVWRWDSDAFGLGAANQDPDSDTNLVNIRLRFPGQYLDEETGAHYNYFRDYDAVTGRYIQSDPIGLLGGPNTYAYVAANPLAWADPYGLVVNVSAGGRPQYNAAVAYLRRDPGMAAIIDRLEKSSTVYTVLLNNVERDSYDPMTRTIYWDPSSAMVCPGGSGSQSPALGLGHEMAHAEGGGTLAEILRLIPWGVGNYLEERRVILGPETDAAITLGEGTRTEHVMPPGSLYRSPSPTRR